MEIEAFIQALGEMSKRTEIPRGGDGQCMKAGCYHPGRLITMAGGSKAILCTPHLLMWDRLPKVWELLNEAELARARLHFAEHHPTAGVGPTGPLGCQVYDIVGALTEAVRRTTACDVRLREYVDEWLRTPDYGDVDGEPGKKHKG